MPAMKDYLKRSRAPRYSILFALPLLLLYEGFSALLTGSAVEGVRNGADVLLKSLFLSLGGRDGLAVFGAVLFGTGALLVWRDRKKSGEPLDRRVFGFMLAESAAYATVFGFVVGWLTRLVLLGPGALTIGGAAALTLPTQLVVSSLIFSAFHYVGALGDTFTVASFTFRAIAGVVFSVLYVTRGLGITAWTHALYDLGLSLLTAAG